MNTKKLLKSTAEQYIFNHQPKYASFQVLQDYALWNRTQKLAHCCAILVSPNKGNAQLWYNYPSEVDQSHPPFYLMPLRYGRYKFP